MRIAITRAVSPAIAGCELTHLERVPIDPALASRQHREYERLLESLGCVVESLPAEPELPDSVFVEDTAVVLDELAILARPGAASRRAETASIAAALEPHRRLVAIEAPGRLDGGDVLLAGRDVFVGRSQRTNESGFQQVRALLGPLGYAVTAVPVRSCLHLKSAVTRVGPRDLLINRSWVDAEAFPGLRLVDVDPEEPSAANALLVGEVLVFPAAFPRTWERLSASGIRVVPVDISELAKAEGGVTCCSLIL
jgi:dimethylargininase